MEYLRNVIKQFEDELDDYENTHSEINKLFKTINYNRLEEQFSDLDQDDIINPDDIINCSKNFRLQDFPTPIGTNFFSIYNPLQAVNVIIPDIFRQCGLINPELFADVVNSTRICPKLTIKFEDTGFNSSLSRFQRTIPKNLIKSFLYFGYKGDPSKMDSSRVTLLEIKLKDIVDKISSNESNYTDPNVIFNLLYDNDTLLKSILQLNDILNKAKLESTDFTNIGSFNVNYLFTYYALAFVKSTGLSRLIYGNVNDKNSTSFSYSDLVYLNYLRKLLSNNSHLDNFVLILENDIFNSDLDASVITTLKSTIKFIKDNNIFNIINDALTVQQYILEVITYNLNNKTYKIANFAKVDYLNYTKNLYCNYAKNMNHNYPEIEIPNYCL